MKYLNTMYACSILSLTSCEVLLLPGYVIGETVKGVGSAIDAGIPLTMANEPFVFTIDGYKISIDVPKYARTIDPNYIVATRTIDPNYDELARTFGPIFIADADAFVTLGQREWSANGVPPWNEGRCKVRIKYSMVSDSSIHYYKFRNYKFNEPMPIVEKIGNYNVLVSPNNKYMEVEINKRLILKMFGYGPKNHDPIMHMKRAIQNMKIEEVPGVAHQTLLPLPPDPRSLAVAECRIKAKSGASKDYLNLYYALLKSPDYFEQDEAHSWLIKSANDNHPQAQWELALYHYKNVLVNEELKSQNLKESKLGFHWLVRSANNNCAEAQYSLGSMLWRGFFSLPPKAIQSSNRPSDIPQNDKEAAMWLEKSAAAGNHNAIADLMHFYAYSKKLRNRDSVAKWQAHALAAGLYDEVFEFLCLWGFTLGAGKDGYMVDNDAALKCLKDAEFIRKNHKIKPVQKKYYKDGIYDVNPVSTVMIKIGVELAPRKDWARRETFWFVATNFDQAMFWFQKSGEIGGPEYWEASASKFISCRRTDNVAENQGILLKEHFWTKAAKAGNAEACYRLGEEFTDQKKYDLAMKWLLTGADYELKNPASMDHCVYYLARAYEEGKITERNFDKAKFWYETYLKHCPKGNRTSDVKEALKRLK